MKELNTIKSLAVTFLIIFATSLLSINNRNINSSIVTIEKGMSLNSVAKLLYDQDIISNQNIFKFKVVVRGLDSKIPTGKFLVNGNVSDAKLIDLFWPMLEVL